jgi:DNA-binding transcriptional LysR family regulator
MPVELRHLRYFVTAAEERSISRAAARLNISQPAVSRQIHDLEDELGVPLFERGSNGLALTRAGAAALFHAKEVLRRAGDLAVAVAPFRGGPERTLEVGFIPTALPGFLAAGLRAFSRGHPGVCTQIREMSPKEQEDALRRGELDLALPGAPCPELAAEFCTAAIRKSPMAIVLPDDHPLAGRRALDLAELAGEPFVSLHERHFPGRPALLADLFGSAGIAPEVGLKADGLQELLGLVAAGAGVGVLPADVAQLPHPGAVFVKMRKPRLTLVSSAVWRRDRESPELLALVEALKQAGGAL